MKIFNNLKNLLILPVGISMLALFAVVYFFFIPVTRIDDSLKQQIRNKRVDLGVAQAPIKEYGALKEDIHRRNAELAEMEKQLFWERDISRFLNELTRLASDLDIEFVSLNPQNLSMQQESEGSEKESKSLSSVPIAVAFKSSYGDTMKLLKRIEEGQKFIRIDSLNIDSESNNILKHLTKMGLSIFVENGG